MEWAGPRHRQKMQLHQATGIPTGLIHYLKMKEKIHSRSIQKSLTGANSRIFCRRKYAIPLFLNPSRAKQQSFSKLPKRMPNGDTNHISEWLQWISLLRLQKLNN